LEEKRTLIDDCRAQGRAGADAPWPSSREDLPVCAWSRVAGWTPADYPLVDKQEGAAWPRRGGTRIRNVRGGPPNTHATATRLNCTLNMFSGRGRQLVITGALPRCCLQTDGLKTLDGGADDWPLPMRTVPYLRGGTVMNWSAPSGLGRGPGSYRGRPAARARPFHHREPAGGSRNRRNELGGLGGPPRMRSPPSAPRGLSPLVNYGTCDFGHARIIPKASFDSSCGQKPEGRGSMVTAPVDTVTLNKRPGHRGGGSSSALPFFFNRAGRRNTGRRPTHSPYCAGNPSAKTGLCYSAPAPLPDGWHSSGLQEGGC